MIFHHPRQKYDILYFAMHITKLKPTMNPKLSVPTSRISLHSNYIKDNSGVDESLYMLNMGYKVVNIDNSWPKHANVSTDQG